MPAPSVPLVTISSKPPTPPQYILSQTLSKQQEASSIKQAASSIQQESIPNQQSNSSQELNYNSNNNSNYNPNDFINPTTDIPVEFNIKPQITSDFLTRNDSCSLPNPPASCPVRTNPSMAINSDLEARFNRRDSTYEQISPFSNMNSNNEAEFIKKISKKNKDIENVAIAFVSVIVLLFLLVIFNSIRNKSGLVNTK
jgi:hypothetical protein